MPAWNQRFFASTRGRLVLLLRRASSTVEELARSLELTDNAVRAHLATLERDGLVRQIGVRRGPGSGKPAYSYELTPEAEELFPKAYGELLRQLLLALRDSLAQDELEAVLRETARRLAAGHQPAAGLPLEARVAGAVSLLDQMGGLASYEPSTEGYVISGCSCPVRDVLPDNPAACH